MAQYQPGIATSSADAVGLFDQNFRQIVETARPLKALIKEYSKPMEHPIETGAVVTDHRIIMPTEIDLDVMLRSDDYRTSYAQIKQLFDNATLMLVQTRTRVYSDMFLVEIPHEEDPDLFDVIHMPLKLKQVQLINAQTGRLSVGTVRNPNNASTVNRGQQQPGNSGSILSQVFR
jgi:hypothetical protein